MLAIRCFRIAGIYLLVGMGIGIAMGATGNFALLPLHAHVNLLGWVGLAIFGGVFRLWPALAETRLAQVSFWAYNLALPVVLASLARLLLGHTDALPVMAAGELAVFAAAVMFVACLFLPASRASDAPATLRRQLARVS